MLELVKHTTVNPDGTLPDTADCLYAYILAGNGVFVRAVRPGLEALIPVMCWPDRRIASVDPACACHTTCSRQFTAGGPELV